MLFCCDNCGCVDDTDLINPNAVVIPAGTFLCSHCRDVEENGEVVPGEWHGAFPREEYDPKYDVVCNRPNNIGLG